MRLTEKVGLQHILKRLAGARCHYLTANKQLTTSTAHYVVM